MNNMNKMTLTPIIELMTANIENNQPSDKLMIAYESATIIFLFQRGMQDEMEEI